MIPVEAVEAHVLRQLIAAIQEHLDRHGPLPELKYRKRALIHNGKKARK